ncbi:MAG: DegV family protein [Candidatus Shapirobacteria bacterium]|jgi:hypothetical protein
MNSLNLENLSQMFFRAAEKVDENKHQINLTNFFPVPDKDTGNNLSQTLNGIKRALISKNFTDINDFRSLALEGALDSASGNIGIIYTGFLVGFLQTFQQIPIEISNLATAFQNGFKKAHTSIQNPKTGTVLDVIKAVSLSFAVESRKNKNIILAFQNSIKSASKAVDATRSHVGISGKTSSVDAGGLGFLIALEGFLEALNHQDVHVVQKQKFADSPVVAISDSGRFEIICLLKPSVNNFDCLKNLGDSLDIITVNQKTKIHIHTNHPDPVIKKIKSLGKVLKIEKQDLLEQISVSARLGGIGLIVDGAADLPKNLLFQYDIPVAPFRIIKSGKVSTTSQPSPKIYHQLFQSHLKKYQKIICLTISSLLSGSYNSALQARSLLSLYDQRRVHIIDSFCVSGGEAILALQILELIAKKQKAKIIVKKIKSQIPKIHTIALIDDPKWAEMGGRLSHTKANIVRVLKKLKLNPFLQIKDGVMKNAGLGFGGGDLARVMFDRLKKYDKPNYRLQIIITHTANQKLVKNLQQLLENYGIKVIFSTVTSPVLSVHLGPGSIVCSYVDN